LRLPAIDTEGAGWLAVGDAAASYDPIVARGITKALADGAADAQVRGRGSGMHQYPICPRAMSLPELHIYVIKQRLPPSSLRHSQI